MTQKKSSDQKQWSVQTMTTLQIQKLLKELDKLKEMSPEELEKLNPIIAELLEELEMRKEQEQEKKQEEEKVEQEKKDKERREEQEELAEEIIEEVEKLEQDIVELDNATIDHTKSEGHDAKFSELQKLERFGVSAEHGGRDQQRMIAAFQGSQMIGSIADLSNWLNSHAIPRLGEHLGSVERNPMGYLNNSAEIRGNISERAQTLHVLLNKYKYDRAEDNTARDNLETALDKLEYTIEYQVSRMQNPPPTPLPSG